MYDNVIALARYTCGQREDEHFYLTWTACRRTAMRLTLFYIWLAWMSLSCLALNCLVVSWLISSLATDLIISFTSIWMSTLMSPLLRLVLYRLAVYCLVQSSSYISSFTFRQRIKKCLCQIKHYRIQNLACGWKPNGAGAQNNISLASYMACNFACR